MKDKHLLKTILIALIGLFALLRLINLGTNPIILNRDEAALGYNAWLLSQTGWDEWHQKWPLMIKSFGDYKLPGYVYLLVPLFRVFSTSDFLLRLPACLSGIILIYLSINLAKKLGLKKITTLIFALSIAITPVFFFYSRMAWEANLGLTLLIGSLICLLNKQKLFNYLGIILILLACFTYNTPYLLLPFILVALIFWQKMIGKKTNWLIILALGIVFIGTSLMILPLTNQKSGITIFTDPTVRANYINYRADFSGLSQKILANQYIYWASLMFKNTLASFSYQFLVKNGGGHPWHSQPGFAHLNNSFYFVGLASLVFNLGKIIIDLIKRRKIQLPMVFLIWLLFSALIPSVITTDAPHATRSLLFFYLFNLMAVIGLEQFYLAVIKKKPMLVKTLLLILASLISLETGRYFYHYFVSYPQQQTALQPGYQKVLAEVKSTNQAIAVVDPSGYQYISTAWYLKLPTKIFLDTVIHQNPNQIGLSYGERINNYHFIAQKEDRNEQEKILIIWENGQWVIQYY